MDDENNDIAAETYVAEARGWARVALAQSLDKLSMYSVFKNCLEKIIKSSNVILYSELSSSQILGPGYVVYYSIVCDVRVMPSLLEPHQCPPTTVMRSPYHALCTDR